MPKTKAKKTKSIASMIFKSKSGQQVLFIKVDSKIEKLFRSSKVETSENYKDSQGKGLKYYTLSEKLIQYTDKYMQSTGESVSLQKYGSDLYMGGYPNVSILRTKGISKGVELIVNDLIVDDDVQKFYNRLAKYIKFLQSTFVNNSDVKA